MPRPPFKLATPPGFEVNLISNVNLLLGLLSSCAPPADTFLLGCERGCHQPEYVPNSPFIGISPLQIFLQHREVDISMYLGVDVVDLATSEPAIDHTTFLSAIYQVRYINIYKYI